MQAIKHSFGYILLNEDTLYFTKSSKEAATQGLKEAVISKNSGITNFLIVVIILIILALNTKHIMQAIASGKIVPILVLALFYLISLSYFWLYKTFMPKYLIPKEKIISIEQKKTKEILIHFTDAKGNKGKQALKISEENYQTLLEKLERS